MSENDSRPARKPGHRPDAFIPFYVADHLADTAHLSTVEQGAYLLLLFTAWRNGGPLPDDDIRLSRISKMSLAEWLTVRDIILAFFTVHEITAADTDGEPQRYRSGTEAQISMPRETMRRVLRHGRIDHELGRAVHQYELRKAASQAANAEKAKKRRRGNDTAAEPQADRNGTAADTDGEPQRDRSGTEPQPPSFSPSEKKEGGGNRPKKRGLENEGSGALPDAWRLHPAGIRLRLELGEAVFDAWLGRCLLVIDAAGAVTLEAPTTLIRDRICHRMMPALERAFEPAAVTVRLAGAVAAPAGPAKAPAAAPPTARCEPAPIPTDQIAARLAALNASEPALPSYLRRVA